MLSDYISYDYNWKGFIISFLLLAIAPVWVIKLFDMGFFTRVGLTLLLGVIVFFAVKTGGAKRGFISGRR